MLSNYFKIAFRNLWKNKTFNFLNIFGLSIGIACAGFIFLWVENEFSYDDNNKKKDQLYKVIENQPYEGKTYTFHATPGLLAPALKDEFPAVKNSCRLTWDQYTLFGLGDKTIYQRGYYADSNIFSMFTIPFVQGKKDRAFEQLHSLVISEKMAKRFFPPDGKDAIGKMLKVDNNIEYAVTGVMKDLPQNSSLQFDWLAPFQIYFERNHWLTEWTNNGIQSFVELNNGTSVAELNGKLKGYLISKDTSNVAQPFLFSMNDWRLRNDFEEGKQIGGRIQYVRMFAIIAWVILLIACINFMNLATARSQKRSREVGVRKVLGAMKNVLVGQFLSETIFMSFVAVGFAVALMYLLLPLFNSVIGQPLSIGLDNPAHIISLIIIGLICGLIAGSYPALYLSSFNPIMVIKGLKIKGSAPVFIRKGLVIVQFTTSIVLIIVTIIIYQQIQHIRNRELGYNKENLMQTGLRGQMQKHFPVIKEELLTTGHVANVAMSSLNMLDMGSQTDNIHWNGKDPGKKILITEDFISSEYISAMGVKIKEGRDFYLSSDSFSTVINETLANMIGKNPVGQVITRDTGSGKGINYTIIGVAKDFVFGDMYAKADPLVFFPYPANFGYMYIKLKPQVNTEKAIADIGNVVKRNNPGFPFDYVFVDKEFDMQFKTEVLIGKLSRLFALLAIIISCLGLFGLAAYTAERRVKEIGIRKVLGASVPGIISLLSKDFLQLVLISAVVAFPIAWWAMNSWLQNFAYRISIGWYVFFIAGFLAMIIALITISFQSIKAAISNPIKSLRTE